MHVSVALADVHVIADTDNVSHERDHVSCFAYSLAMGNLRLAFVQILNFQTKQITCRSKRETCTGRIIAE